MCIHQSVSLKPANRRSKHRKKYFFSQNLSNVIENRLKTLSIKFSRPTKCFQTCHRRFHLTTDVFNRFTCVIRLVQFKLLRFDYTKPEA